MLPIRTIPLLLILLTACDQGRDQVVRSDRFGRPRVVLERRGLARDGRVRFLDPHGDTIKTGTYEQDRKSGTWTTRSPNGRLLSEEHYVEGRLDGRARSWTENGVLVREEHYRNGLLNGPVEHRFQDGAPKLRASYVMGRLDGSYTRWRREGQDTARARTEGWFDIGLSTGIWTGYHPNGSKRREGRFDRDIRTGDWKEWDPHGRLVRTITYAQGKVVRDVREPPPAVRGSR